MKAKVKVSVIGLLVLAMLLLPATVNAAPPCPCGEGATLEDSIDIGSGDTTHHMSGWGPVEPATSGGTWGGVANPPEDGTCRAAWEPDSKGRAKNGRRIASFKMAVGTGRIANRLELRVLDGLADDSFEVYINRESTPRYTYTGEQSGTEDWKTHSVDLTGLRGTIKVKVKATGPAWSSFSTYGQLGVEWAKLYACDALDYVDIGNTGSELSRHKMQGWGPPEPSTSGGNWGGIAPGDCRVIWEKGKGDLYRSAYIRMKVPKGMTANSLKLRVLDGQADDSYAVFVNNQLVHWATLAPGGGETWGTHTIPLSGLSGTLHIVILATGPAWSSHGTYGQVAFDWAVLCP